MIRSSLFSGNGVGELGSVQSIQMFIEQLVCRRLKVQVSVFVTASVAQSATTHSMCLNRTLKGLPPVSTSSSLGVSITELWE